MSKLGKFGALAGLGQGISQYGETLRQQWLQAAQARAQADNDLAKDQRASQEWDRREGVTRTNNREDTEAAHGYTVDLEGVRHTNAMALEGEKRRDDPKDTEFWRADDVSYKVEGGVTFALRPGSNQWERVAEPGEAASLPIDPYELELNADEYADKRISETAGWLSTDKTDFAQHGGSREKAREAFRQEFMQNRGAAPAPAPASDSAELPEVLRSTAANAKAAIERGVPKELIVQRLKDAGATDDEIRRMAL